LLVGSEVANFSIGLSEAKVTIQRSGTFGSQRG